MTLAASVGCKDFFFFLALSSFKVDSIKAEIQQLTSLLFFFFFFKPDKQ